MKHWLIAAALALAPASAPAHDIYTGIRGTGGQLCCGANDCAATTYRESGGNFEFLTREQHWISIPVDRITFLPIPGDPPSDDTHHAHLCYGEVMDSNGVIASGNVFRGEGQAIYLYCAFIPPGSI